MKKKNCGHFWRVIRTENLLPHCSIVDCVMECEICKKVVTGTISIDETETSQKQRSAK